MIRRNDPLADAEPLVRRVYAYVARRIGDGPDAEDVTGAVFERAVRYRSSYDRRQGAPVVWLIGIARRCLDDHHRERARTERAPLDAVDRETPGAGFEDRSLGRIELSRALAGLSEGDRELIALRYGAGLTAREIAAVLDTRVNTVEVALHRALGRLRSRMGSGAPSGAATPAP